MNAVNNSDPSQALAWRWFQKAENDLLDVANNLNAEQYASDTVCFHCQQAAEKYLKGLLAWHKMPFAKTHDLPELLKQVQQITGDDARAISERVYMLDPYSVSVRYPQECEEEPDEQEVQEAVESAYVIKKWVRSQLKLKDTE